MSAPWLLAGLWLLATVAQADGPRDNMMDKVRPIPPKGIAVPAEEQRRCKRRSTRSARRSRRCGPSLKGKPALLDLLPDVQIYYNAVRYALTYNEFFDPERDQPSPRPCCSRAWSGPRQLRERQGALDDRDRPGRARLRLEDRRLGAALRPGRARRSYRPDTADAAPARHLVPRPRRDPERGELHQRPAEIPGEFTPPDTFVLHPYGRYCNANQFAGEIDTFEALATSSKHYPIDENRIAVRGFSMGGAACWQFAVHYAGHWAAAAPGAGFSETADFLQGLPERDREADLVRAEAAGTCTTAPTTPSTCPTAPRSPTAARRTGRSRPPT